MADYIQFVQPAPIPVDIPLPGLPKGNIMALKLGNESQGNNYWAILAVEKATQPSGGGDITYYGNCLLYVIGDQTLTWTRLITVYEKALVTVAQLAKMPDPPYLRQIRMQPVPDDGGVMVVQEVPGVLITNVAWDPMNKFTITFRGNWCPLFRQP